MINDKLKRFIQENIDLIDDNKFGELYKQASDAGVLRCMITEALLGAGINPLEYMNYVPDYFLFDSKITQFTIPDNITSIGRHAFQHCTSLKSITIPDNVTSIGQSAFYNCSSLTSIIIPNSVTSIGGESFKNCTSLTSITYTGTKEQWKATSKGSDWHVYVPATVIHCSDGDVSL